MISCNCQKWTPSFGCSEGRDRDIYGNPIELVNCLYYQPLTCAHCGHQGQDVTRQSKHIGGFPAPLVIIACQNEVACWGRWERNQLARIRR